MRPVGSLHQAAYLLAGLTLASQIIALLRDRMFAYSFGAGQTLDLYYAAFRVPDLVFALVSSLVSAYVIIPLISRMDREETQKLLSETSTFLFAAGGALCIVLAIFMPQFLSWLYPTLAASPAQGDFILLGRILLIQPILLGLSGIISSVTQVNRRFFLFALSPVLYNLGIITGTLFLYPLWGLPGIGVGVVLGAAAYMAINFPVVIAAGVTPSWRWPTFSLMLPVVRHSVPRSLALGMSAVTTLILTAFASRIGTGSVSVFTFAANLEAVPLGLIGASYAVAAFPALSQASALERRDEFTAILSAGARHVILWSIVALGLIAVLRAHIVRVILGTGAFDWDATRLTAALFVVLAVGLAADALELLFSRALYAARQSWRPLLYQIAAGIFKIGLALALLSLPAPYLLTPLETFLKVSNVPGTPVLLLALASAAGQIFLVILSLVALRRVAPGIARGLIEPIREGCLAAIAAGAAAYVTLKFGGDIAPLTTLAAVFTEGMIAGAVGLAAAALVLYFIGNKEFQGIVEAVTRLVRIGTKRLALLAPSGEEPI